MNPPPASTPEQGLAEGYARHVERWSLASGAPASTARLARQAAEALSRATSSGHVCLALRQLENPPAPADAWRAALLSSGVVGTAEAPGAMPMVLDSDGRLYLHRHFDDERRLARRLVRASTARAVSAADATTIRQRLTELYAGNAAALGDAADWQQLATALALRGGLTIVSGGPGTGKTTTVVSLLAILLELDPLCRIALAAPTGKAAARMTEAIRERAVQLPASLRERLPTQSSTVHRLLGVTRSGSGFVHHAGRPLAIDALVVDEASMLDLALATRLFDAVPETARIVLLGDKDQLCAVESGAVFAELGVDPTLSEDALRDLAALTGTPSQRIRPPPPAAPSALRDAVVWLTHSYRFTGDSGIGRLAWLVNTGQAEPACDWLRRADAEGVRWIDDAHAAPAPQSMQAITDGYSRFFAALARDPRDHRTVVDAYARFRVLCAVRDGPRGVLAMNAQIEQKLRAALASPGAGAWFTGRPVLVRRNDHALKLFNGDIGLALPDESGQLWVQFPQPGGGLRAIAPMRLPEHETAFAMTIHQSQGSEYDEVLVLLPEARSRVLTRELLYTAVTRARLSVTLCAGAAALRAAIQTSTRRDSGLQARLREEAGR